MRAVLFDFDGVIADTETIHYLTGKEVLKRRGYDLTRPVHDKTTGISMNDTWKVFREYFGFNDPTDVLMKEYFEVFDSKIDSDVRLVSGIRDVIYMAVTDGMKIAIGSSGEIDYILRIIGKFDLPFKKDQIVTAKMAGRGKPFPDIYIKAANMLRVPPSECLVIDDAPNGIQAATNAGMRSIYLNSYLPMPEGAVNCIQVDSLLEVTPDMLR